MKHTEQNYIIKDAKAICGNTIIENAFIMVRNGLITAITQHEPKKDAKALPVFDAKGKIAGPGLIDMHIHGCGGTDTGSDNLEKSLLSMADFLSCRGVTSFQPTLVMHMESLHSIAAALKKHPFLAARIPGIYIEGPFIAPQKVGGLRADTIKTFSRVFTEEILSVNANTALGFRSLVKTMTIAPELDGADELQSMLAASNTLTSWGHSAAYLSDVAHKKPLHLTHLFNAMNGIDHRNPGLALLPFIRQGSGATFEIICDTIHVNPTVLEFVFTSPAAKNACIISDCMSSGGMGAGEFIYLERESVSDGRVSRYKDNQVLIGSSMLIPETAQGLFQAGLVDEAGFFYAASSNPARSLGLSDRGILKSGKKADIVLCDQLMNVTDVFTH